MRRSSQWGMDWRLRTLGGPIYIRTCWHTGIKLRFIHGRILRMLFPREVSVSCYWRSIANKRIG
ncbi:hypothetical protein I7I50_11287 [Histoplasma capsulatum G186AR]|uniref:Uncharacterized protein n=1 Tax=Ajellomyces capsulatus TaxID=5037 RepID=A0A8H7ZAK8_AJECA|nr:hypothetical protein I7I52_02525 [Histoplasma capsulatum]QSS69858.1 hypothetical protein I7I50_11287 [Histoplasma capsulatum G186AR]